MATSSQRVPIAVKLVAALMSVVVSGLGILAFATHYAPERSTRHGLVPALEGAQADAFGVTAFLVGLLPMALVLGTARRAAWFGGIVGALAVASLAIGAR